MNRIKRLTQLTVPALAFMVVLISPGKIRAHCDGLDGPVVTAARKALETRNVNLVLIWVRKDDEAEIRAAFQETLAVRKQSPQAKELADRYFFETLVRIHRAGEGAPYTGLKPAGRDLGPAIPAADKALESGSAEVLLKLLTDVTKEGLHQHFAAAIGRKDFRMDDVLAGRTYVEAYVSFVHYVEHLYEAAKRTADGHYPESAGTGAHE